MRRTLKLDQDKEVHVDLFEPELEPDEAYICRYTVSGLSKPLTGSGMGIDAIQALFITLQLIGNRLYSMEEFKNKRLTWEGSLDGSDLGFPTSNT